MSMDSGSILEGAGDQVDTGRADYYGRNAPLKRLLDDLSVLGDDNASECMERAG